MIFKKIQLQQRHNQQQPPLQLLRQQQPPLQLRRQLPPPLQLRRTQQLQQQPLPLVHYYCQIVNM